MTQTTKEVFEKHEIRKTKKTRLFCTFSNSISCAARPMVNSLVSVL